VTDAQKPTQERNLDPLMCPVKSAAYIVHRICHLPGSSDATTIDTFIDFSTGKFVCFKVSALLKLFRAVATAMGTDVLGFGPSEIGTHSNRSACAMAMYLNGVPVYTVTLVGHWSSDAFLLYIRKLGTGIYQWRLIQDDKHSLIFHHP
jgi:hypothetical protein